MPEVKGLIGIRPKDNDIAKEFAAPPYDVITYGTKLQTVLSSRKNLVHIHLRPKEEGEEIYNNAKKALKKFRDEGILIEDNEPCYYIYEQEWEGGERIGVICAVEVSDYQEGKIIRHEKTFDDKVTDRLNLRKATGYQMGNILGVVEDKSGELLTLLNNIASSQQPIFNFVCNFEGSSDMEGSINKIYRVPQASEEGKKIPNLLLSENIYIADGHHRYHASLKLGQKFTMMYISPSGSAKIQPYGRVIGNVDEEKLANLPHAISNDFDIKGHDKFEVPEKHSFIFYFKVSELQKQKTGQALARRHFKDKILKITIKPEVLEEAKNNPLKMLDASILQNRILFPYLGLSTENIKDKRYLNYFPGNPVGLAQMKELVDRGNKYQFAVSLAAVDFNELKAVADKGIEDPEIVMPQKSTYFWPKLLSGIILYKFERKVL
ncbi:DUF1015 domain-containing protein [bacterium]|nr:DUF1015 domain-containing protein [bacterium]